MSSTRNAQHATEKTTFVLVHGAWHGGWCWDAVSDLLRAFGHRVLSPTLTGLGSKSSQLTPNVGLNTHIDDIVDVFQQEVSGDCVLVGHSYGGIVITGVVDRLRRLQVAPNARLIHLVYLDAVLAQHGESWSSCQTPEQISARLAQKRHTSNGTEVIPPPNPALLGLSSQLDQTRVRKRLTPHPFRCYFDVLDAPTAATDPTPKTYIDCQNPPLAALEKSKQRAATDGWRSLKLDAGHDCMVSASRLTAAALLDHANGHFLT